MNYSTRDFEIFGITGYTVMSNYHLRDSNLSLKAKGLLSMMLSMSRDWDYSISGLEKISQEGKYAIRTILDELKKAKYVQIKQYRDEKGFFKYKYMVYYLPYLEWLKTRNYPDINNRYTDNRNADNCTQININNKKDKIDKTKIEHNLLTKELINLDYINEDDSSSFLFDDLFEKLIDDGNTYKDLLTITHYIIKRVKDRNFIDENDNEIKNKYGYFKSSITSNINKFKNYSEDLYSEDDFDWLSDFDNEEEIDL